AHSWQAGACPERRITLTPPNGKCVRSRRGRALCQRLRQCRARRTPAKTPRICRVPPTGGDILRKSRQHTGHRRTCSLGGVTALLAPGQGSQAPGMLTPWLDSDSTGDATSTLQRWSHRTGLDLRRLGTEAEADELADTAITQPLIVATSLLAHEQLRRRVDIPPQAPVAGHSIGELAAAAIAGVLDPDDAVALAAVRGTEMAKACAAQPTSMAAVMLGDPEEVTAWLHSNDLVAANRNGAGQIVASGPTTAIDHIVAEPMDGTKVRKLKVAGAFHTRFMAPASTALRE